MPPKRSTKKSQTTQQVATAAVIETPQHANSDDMDADNAADLYEQRYFNLHTAYVTQVMQEFKAENAGPKLDKVVAYVETLSKLESELEALANVMNEKISGYMNSGQGMAAVLSVQKQIDELQAKICEASAVPAGCNDLVKAYRRACAASLYGQ